MPVDNQPSPKDLALVMKGGGIKGLAYVGALDVLKEKYTFTRYVGTSAGAVTAVLLAAGYTPSELKEILEEKDFRDFFDAPWYKRPFNLLVHKGMHPADAFTDWLDRLLSAKLGIPERVKLSDLPKRVTIYASRRDKRALKFDRIDNDADAAYAVRCSMSIPFVFFPQSDQGIRTYDGGLQHNFPVDELLREEPDCEFISLYLGAETYEPIKRGSVISDLLATWLDAGEREAITEHRDRTVIIDPRPVSTLDFDLSEEDKAFLLSAGRCSALKHLGLEEQAVAAAKERDELKSVAVKQREAAARRAKRKRFGICAILIAAIIALCVIYWPKPPDPTVNRIVGGSGMDITNYSEDLFDSSNPGISLLHKKLEIDFRNRVEVPPDKRDAAKTSPSVQTYNIRAVRKSDDARYFVQEFASQRKLMDIECISDHPYTVWYRIDGDPLGKGFKNIWTLVVDLEQHSRDIPFELIFRVTRYNAYQAKDLNFVGHFVSHTIPLIETKVFLPKGYKLEEAPSVDRKETGVPRNEWEAYTGDSEITSLEEGAEFLWILRNPPPGWSYKATIDWIEEE